jgi:hypothetical protein
MAEPPKPIAVPPATPGGGDPSTAIPPRPVPPASAAARPAPPPAPAARRRGGVVLPLLLLILLALIGGSVYLAATAPQQLFTLMQTAGVQVPNGGPQVADMQAQIRALQQRPQPVPTDLRPLEQRLAALEQRVGAVEQRPAATTGDGGASVDLGPLEQRLAALEQRASDGSAVQELAGRLKAVEQSSQTTAAQAGRMARLQAAAVALDAGKPLGDIPGAPPALARFATAAPPTLSSLRLSFPAAAAAAERESAPPDEGQTFAERMLQKAQKLITVREGEKVLVGAPAIYVLTQAHNKLEVGDLVGAVGTLEGLDAEAAKAMAPWRAQAQSLLDARAALAGLANS